MSTMKLHPDVKTIWQAGLMTLSIISEKEQQALSVTELGCVKLITDLSENHVKWHMAALHAMQLFSNIST